MDKRVIVGREDLRFGIAYAVRRALRRWLGRGDHQPLAEHLAEAVLSDFDRARWEVQRPDSPPPGQRAAEADG